jgi:glutathione-independent formaldehyde dehydrogenase
MNQLVASVRATGAVGVVGVYVPADPGSPDELGREGRIAFDFGLFFQKGLRMGSVRPM